MQRYVDGCDTVRLPAEAGNERQRRLHRPDRVRTRWADTDLENVEDADRGHAYSVSSDSRLALPPTAAMLLLTVNSVPNRGR